MSLSLYLPTGELPRPEWKQIDVSSVGCDDLTASNATIFNLIAPNFHPSGLTGPQGPTGPPFIEGPTGPTGPVGVGQTGPHGPTGPSSSSNLSSGGPFQSLVLNGTPPNLTVKSVSNFGGVSSGITITPTNSGTNLAILNTLCSSPIMIFNTSSNMAITNLNSWRAASFDTIYPTTWSFPDFSTANMPVNGFNPLTNPNTYAALLANITGFFSVNYRVVFGNSSGNQQTVGACIFYTPDAGSNWYEMIGSMTTSRIGNNTGCVLSNSINANIFINNIYVLAVWASGSVNIGAHSSIPTPPVTPATNTDYNIVMSFHMIQPQTV